MPYVGHINTAHFFFIVFIKFKFATHLWNSLQKKKKKKKKKNAYSNILKILQPKKANFLIKNSDIFNISAQKIDCWNPLEPPRQGGSNEYSQSMFFSKIRKIMCTAVNPNFTI